MRVSIHPRFRRDSTRRRSVGFTLVELLVVIAIIGVLIALLLPAVQAAREAARRSTCQNNLKQVGLAVLNRESGIRSLPTGAMSQLIAGSSNSSAGQSWIVEILPNLEQQDLYNQLDRTGPSNGFVLLHKQNALTVDGVLIPSLLCPSSSLPSLISVAGAGIQMMIPSYVGISGATNSDTFLETRVNVCCQANPKGEISAGGTLIPNQNIRLKSITDGLSHTLIAGETSELLYGADGKGYRIEGGHAAGWLAGTFMVGTPPDYIATPPSPSWNLTTISYAPNSQSYGAPGINTDHGPNNPLNSAHPDGVNVVLADGAVNFLTSEIVLDLLKSMATRDDGQTDSRLGD